MEHNLKNKEKSEKILKFEFEGSRGSTLLFFYTLFTVLTTITFYRHVNIFSAVIVFIAIVILYKFLVENMLKDYLFIDPDKRIISIFCKTWFHESITPFCDFSDVIEIKLEGKEILSIILSTIKHDFKLILPLDSKEENYIREKALDLSFLFNCNISYCSSIPKEERLQTGFKLTGEAIEKISKSSHTDNIEEMAQREFSREELRYKLMELKLDKEEIENVFDLSCKIRISGGGNYS